MKWRDIYIYGCFQKYGTPKSSILIGFSIINHPFWGFSHYFWKHPYMVFLLFLGGTFFFSLVLWPLVHRSFSPSVLWSLRSSSLCTSLPRAPRKKYIPPPALRCLLNWAPFTLHFFIFPLIFFSFSCCCCCCCCCSFSCFCPSFLFLFLFVLVIWYQFFVALFLFVCC